jgi:hypothetical protein
MRSKIILTIMVTLLSGATLAADPLLSTGFSELSWLPVSPVQLYVLGLSNLKPVSRHQLEVLESQHKLVVATPASGISPCP